MHVSPAVRRALRPLVIGSQAVPVPVIAPLLILVLGFGLAPKILLVALVCFFPVAINLYDGLRRVDPDARKLLRSFDASRWQTFRLLEAPAALPAAFTGLKVAAAVSVIGAVFAEWAGSDSGLGHALLTANGQLETARAFAATFLLFALAVGALRAVRAARAPGGDVAMSRLAIVVIAALLALAVAGCGEKTEGGAGLAARSSASTSSSTTSPTPTTPASTPRRPSGDYERAGLDVELKPPPDPSAPLKLLQSGQADVVISYEPELLLARDKGSDLVAVGALVQKPLTTLMTLDGSIDGPEDLRGKRVGTAGHPLPDRLPADDPAQRRRRPRGRSRRRTSASTSCPRCSRARSTPRSARSGTTRAPTSAAAAASRRSCGWRSSACRPTTSSIFVARRKDLDEEFASKLRRFLRATAVGHERLRANPEVGVDALLKVDPGLERGPADRRGERDAAGLLPRGPRPSVRLAGAERVGDYGDWMYEQKLLKQPPEAAEALTNEFLPGEGLSPRVTATP